MFLLGRFLVAMDASKEMLSLEYRFILEQRRSELCAKVDVLGSVLLERLCDRGVLSIEKHDDIQVYLLSKLEYVLLVTQLKTLFNF